MQESNLEKFHDFLDRITKDNNKLIVQTCRDGFDLIYKGDKSTNPFAQDDIIEEPEAIFTINPLTTRQISNLDDYTIEKLNIVQKKFDVTLDEIHDNYIVFHQHLTLPEYFNHILSQDKWEKQAYYVNDEDEYYAKIPQKYVTNLNNRYRHNGHTSGS